MSSQHTLGLLQVKISAVLGDAWLMPAGASGENRVREVALVNEPEDARRLAACWNACFGMNTDELEKLADAAALVMTAPSRHLLERGRHDGTDAQLYGKPAPVDVALAAACADRATLELRLQEASASSATSRMMLVHLEMHLRGQGDTKTADQIKKLLNGGASMSGPLTEELTHDELVRELDVMLNGRGALAPTLFDIVQQVRSEGITSAYPNLKPSDIGGDEAAWRAFADTQPAELDRLDGGPLHKAWFDGLRHGRFTNAHLFYLAARKGGAA